MTALRYVARGSPSRNAFVWLVGLVLAMFVITWASGALPPAGSVIGNQANATYTDSGGQTKTATSNLVETVVQQVGSFTLVQDNTKTAAPGNVVYMPHTLTNTGNGSDSFALAFANLAGSFDVSTITVYADANGDGVPDSTTALCASPCTTGVTTPNLPAGGTS